MTTQMLRADPFVTIPVCGSDGRVVPARVRRSTAEALAHIRLFAAPAPQQENVPEPIILIPHEGPMTRRRCVQIASWVSQIDRETLISPTLKGRTAKARQIGYWLTHRFCGATLNEIGQTFGGRDHTSVLHGVRRASSVIASLKLDGLSPEGFAQVLWDTDWRATR
ncbi:Chromosomal replication initiator protein DnaA (modular protein) [Hyphomicrobiales bacterium]|nr:Chromosomal replication initiator protein DnaA (modular protein) [Hyphomicrobiales bacterium]CAH1668722.1 Chromosomal replication initiator protein DnaA (modular protein) [Hyphomicrobiales bacterium]